MYPTMNPKYQEQYSGYNDNPGCKYHPDAPLIDDSYAGDQICSSCGLVVADRVIDVGAEWRTLSDATADPSRVGAAEDPIFQGSNLHTSIAAPVGKSSADLDPAMIRNQQKQVTALQKKVSALREKADRLTVPRYIADDAASLLKRALEHKALKNRVCANSDASAAACIFIACRKDNVPRTFKELSKVSDCNVKQIGRMYKLISKELMVQSSCSMVTNAEDIIPRFASSMELPWKLQSLAMHVAKTAASLQIVLGRNPASVAAAAIHFAVQSSSQAGRFAISQIASVSGTSELTLTQCYKRMLPRMVDLLPDDMEPL